MKISDYLKYLLESDIHIRVINGNLELDAPKGVVTSEIQDQLRERKEEIISYLLKQQADSLRHKGIMQADRTKPIPASSYQRGLWLEYQMEGVNSTYNVPSAYRIMGNLDILALERSLRKLIKRHESLRMSIRLVAEEPCLIVADDVDWDLDIHPIKIDSLQDEIMDLGNQPFLLEQAPLFRAHLWTDSNENHTLLLNFHHIVIDGWSLPIFEKELSNFYGSYLKGEEADIEPLDVDYADYAAWQNNWLESAEFEEGLAYWKEALQGAPELLELPTDHPRPAIQAHHGNHVTLELEQSLVDKLNDLANREKVTLFMVANAAFVILLGRYSNQEDVVIGIPMANRVRQELEGMLGYFVNTMPLRLYLGGEPNLQVFLERMRDVALEAYTHQDIPFEKLVEVLRPGRNPGYNPVFQVIFNNVETSSVFMLDGCQISKIHYDLNTTKFDLSAGMVEDLGSMSARIQFDSDLFEVDTIKRMVKHYVRILEWMVSEPSGSIHDIDILTKEEYQQITHDWNDTTTEYPNQKTIQQLFLECAANNPDKVALSFIKKEITYAELNEQANQLAHKLIEMGISPDVCVGVYIERSIEMIVALLAILKAGGAYVPLDPANSPEWQITILKDTGAPILVSLHRHESDLPEFNGKIVYVDDKSLYKHGNNGEPSVDLTSDNLAYVMYTSGSTGRPKGNCIPHKAVIRLVKDTNYASFDQGEIFLQFAPLAFDASTFEIWGSLLNGAKLVIFPPELPNLDDLADFVKANKITTMWLTAGLFHQIMEWRPDIVMGLNQFLSGGDVLSPRHVRTVLETNPDCQFINGYGPTENTTFTCCYPVKEIPEFEKSIPIGRPISNTQVYILDAHSKPVPVGVVGELYIGGDGLSREYINQPEITRERFLANPFRKGMEERLYKTGDYGRWLADGNIEFVGRKDNQVKLRGFRVELGEIEAVLEQKPEVQQAVVLMREDQPGDKRLVGYIVPKPGIRIDVQRLRDGLREKLPGYMIPSAFVIMESIPLTTNGKIDRKSLPTPGLEDHVSQNYVPPRNEIERKIAEIWKDLLGISRVGLKDDFFELGGHSLLAVQMLSRIQQRFDHAPPLQVFFKNSTLEGLSDSLTIRDYGKISEGIIPIQTEGEGPPLFVMSAGGSYLRELVEALGRSHRVYGLHPFENGRQIYRDSVEDSAQIIARCLLNFYPQGQIQLLGHSGDGCYALETARIMRELGKEVSFLGLLDTYPPPLLAEFKNVDRLHFHMGKIKGKNIIGIIEYVYQVLSRHLPRINEVRELFQNEKPDTVSNKRKDYRYQFLDHYIPQKFDGHVTLFLAKEYEFVEQHEPIKKWHKIFTGRFDIIEVPGEHRTMLEEPFASQLARIISDNLPKKDIDSAT